MPLGRCQDCSNDMSDSAKACPHCGSTRRPVKRVAKLIVGTVTCEYCNGHGYIFVIKHSWSWKWPPSDEARKHMSAKDLIKYILTEGESNSSLESLEGVKKLILSDTLEKENNKIISIDKAVCWACKGSGKQTFQERHNKIKYVDEEM